MLKNDIFRHIRYLFSLNEQQMLAIFALGKANVNDDELFTYTRKFGDAAYKTISDEKLSRFLNGLIIEKRGAKADGDDAPVDEKITNNIVFNKLKIALALKAEDILSGLSAVDIELNKHELSAFFRKSDHKNYRPCSDKILSGFLASVQIQHRGKAESSLINKLNEE